MLYRFIAILLTASLLSACALAPGQKINSDKVTQNTALEASQVELVNITPDLIEKMRSQQNPASIPQELLDYQPSAYQIGPGDVLFITVWNHPELTVPASQLGGSDTNGRMVKADGNIFYPYIGNIQAAGKTTEQLRSDITQKLATYIESPQVDVGVARFLSQRIILSGAFMRTQPIPVTNQKISFLEALGIGQVDLETADLSAVRLVRDNKTYVLDEYALTRHPSQINQIYLKDGDRIHVPFNDHNKVYVMGEVVRPQALPLKSSTINLTDALGTAGGLQQISAKGQDVYVIRGVENLKSDKAQVFQLNAKSPTAFILANNFDLHANDVVFVGAAGVTRWNRVISQILPSLSILSLTSTALKNVNDVQTNN